MEVLVSPNDGPHMAIDDLNNDDYDYQYSASESPQYDLNAEFDTVSMCEHRNTDSENQEGAFLPPIPGIDKLIDRRFACYGVSPRLARKTMDGLDGKSPTVDCSLKSPNESCQNGPAETENAKPARLVPLQYTKSN